ncbi:MAG: hypothetical protein ACRDRF_02295, partial [Pseudonocardiaceae bacterium]
HPNVGSRDGAQVALWTTWSRPDSHWWFAAMSIMSGFPARCAVRSADAPSDCPSRPRVRPELGRTMTW